MSTEKKKEKWLDKTIKSLQEREGKFLGSVLVPFLICFRHKTEFFIWAMFVVVAGQFGTIINVINRVVFQHWSFPQALYPDSVTGSFYTYSLVLVASLIAPIFTHARNNEKPAFRSISMVLSTLLIFTLVFSAIFFSAASRIPHDVNYESFKYLKLRVDIKQLVFFILAILFAWYSFGLSLMRQEGAVNGLDDDYQKNEDVRVGEMVEEGNEVTTDGEGNEI